MLLHAKVYKNINISNSNIIVISVDKISLDYVKNISIKNNILKYGFYTYNYPFDDCGDENLWTYNYILFIDNKSYNKFDSPYYHEIYDVLFNYIRDYKIEELYG